MTVLTANLVKSIGLFVDSLDYLELFFLICRKNLLASSGLWATKLLRKFIAFIACQILIFWGIFFVPIASSKKPDDTLFDEFLGVLQRVNAFISDKKKVCNFTTCT